MFELQRFAENDSQEQMAIPEELSGVSEDIAREVMEQQAENNPEAYQEKDDFDDEGNYTGEKNVADVKIDYSRYKDEVKDKELATKLTSELMNEIIKLRENKC